MNIFQKKKFQYFLYTHILFVLGLVVIQPSLLSLAIVLVVYLLFLQPLFSIVGHLKYSHNYSEFRHPAIEWLMILMLTAYNFFKFSDVKNYHILHHRKWLTDQDPTANEVRQGWLKYYIGNTAPVAIPSANVDPMPKFDFANKYFFLIKFIVYSGIILLFGVEAFFLSIITVQFYFFVFMKLHDMIFHWSDLAQNKPWLFLIYFNDSRHIIHHTEYNGLEAWFLPAINPQYWLYKLIFKTNE